LITGRAWPLAVQVGLLVVLLSTSGCVPEAKSSPARVPVFVSQVATAGPSAEMTPTTFAIIGDYGQGRVQERLVARLVASWSPAFIITTGDNYTVESGGKGTGRYDQSTGAYYGAWLKDISTTGRHVPAGLAPVNAFFPALGNHDYSDSAGPGDYLRYFKLPGDGFSNSSGNERFYDYVEGPIHFFVLNSNPEEKEGVKATSRQAEWLRAQLAASTSPWNVVYDHHAPYSSGALHGSTAYMQWPYAAWGADVMISGHDHTYERIVQDGIVFFVNGLSGQIPVHRFATPVPGSVVRYNGGWGAQRVTATYRRLQFEFYNAAGALVDSYDLAR
jgi:tartrate-resistant acid phosphatase type 5